MEAPLESTGGTGATGVISVIVPALREEERIARTLLQFNELRSCCPVEIIVVDGDPGESTVRAIDRGEIARRLTGPHELKTICCEAGRARQMNAGAKQARGDVLLFLHADSRLAANALPLVCRTMSEGHDAGAFDIRIEEQGRGLDFIAWMANRRSRLTRIPYGDQAIFLKKDYFRALGAYRELPLMEDLDLMRRIKREGGRLRILDDAVTISGRRWLQEGLVYVTLRNWLLASLFFLGVSPERLARFYRYF